MIAISTTPNRSLLAVAVTLLAAATALVLVGCTAPTAGTVAAVPAPDSVIVIASAHQGGPASDLPVELQPTIEAAIHAKAPLSVVTLDGAPRLSFHEAGYTINTQNPQAESDDINRVQAALLAAVRSVKADSDGNNLSQALAVARDQAVADHASNAAIVVVDNGLADKGAPTITSAISEADPATVIDFAVTHNEVTGFPGGTTVYLVGFGYTTAPQPQLTQQQRSHITAIWKGILQKGHATVVVLPTPRNGAGPKTPHTTAIVRPGSMPQLDLQTNGTTTTARLGSDVLFDTGSAALLPAADATLQQLLAVIDGHPGTITVTGYTDSTGTAADNLTLSRQRAASVKQWLVANGANASRIATVGKGEADPAVPNATSPDQLAQNRRVVVTIQASND